MILDKREKRMAIVRAVAAKHSVDVRHLLGNGKEKHIALARWEAFALIKACTDDSYPEIGRLFGKNHSTIVYGVARFFGFLRPSPSKGLGGACEAAAEGLALLGDQLRAEADLYVTAANAAKHQARARNPLYAALMGDRHVA